MVKKETNIIITGDLLRPQQDAKTSAQLTNIIWLYNLLQSQINMVIKDSTSKLQLLRWEEGGFNAQKFYNLNKMESFIENWIEIYEKKDTTQEAKEYFLSFFHNSFVIGFELPELFTNLFNQHNITYIDIIIHPVRYLDDLMLALKTNNQSIFNTIKNYQVDTNQFILNASFHKAKFSRMEGLDLDKNSALFAGQVEFDKSLIKDEKCLSLLSFQKEFTDIASKYDTLYFKKHPYAKYNYQLEQFLKTIPNIKYIDNNFYHILAQEEIKAVYSISSSTVYEAKFWGKDSDYLYKNPFLFSDDKEAEFNSEKYIPANHEILLPTFWHEVLSSVIPTVLAKDVPNLKMPQQANFLRNSLNLSWGYEFLDTSVQLRNTNILTDNSVKGILKFIEKDVQLFKQKLQDNKTQKISLNIKDSFTQKYQTSILFVIAQSIKKVPLLGKSLLYSKQKILKWIK